MKDTNVNLAGAKPNSAVDAINALVEARERLKILDIAKSGLDEGGSKGDHETLAASVVSNAMNTTKEVMGVLQKEKQEAQASASAAYQEADQLKSQLYMNQIEAIKGIQGKLEKSLDDMKKTGDPNSLVNQLSALVQVMDLIEKRFHPQMPVAAAPPSPPQVNPEVTLRLEEMRMNHELAMKKLDLEINMQNKKWDLEMLQFREDSNRRWKEYQDGQKMKRDGINGFQDLVGSLKDSLTREKAIEEGGGVAQQPPAGGEGEADVAIGSFPCQFCKTPVNVPADADKVKCPQCQAEYDISRKG